MQEIKLSDDNHSYDERAGDDKDDFLKIKSKSVSQEDVDSYLAQIKEESKTKTFDEHAADAQGVYMGGALIIGFISAFITFLACWFHAVEEWGFLLGVGLGWLPSFFVAIIFGFILGAIWPLIVIGIAWVIYLIIQS
jgi:hypothetical protein